MAPHQKELEAMTVFELLHGLIWDQSNSSHYRNRLITLLQLAGTTDIKKLVADEFIEDPVPNPKPNNIRRSPDFVAMNVGRKNNGEQLKFFRYILTSGWDGVDPRRKMYTDPERVKGFLQDMIDENIENYGDMSQEQQRLCNTICDSFVNWVRLQG